MHEAMGRYQNKYGLKPIGPHRRLADELFADASVACVSCKGRGLLDGSTTEAWIHCPRCQGMGFVWRRSAGQVEALRRQVLQAFPDAAVETKFDVLSGVPGLNLASGTVEDLKS
jgi:RecJ-like exonuclease